MSLSNVNITNNDELLSENVGYLLKEIVLQLMNTQQIITIGLSGGSLIDLLTSTIPRLRFFFVDERFVPFTSDESTYENYQSKLFRQSPLTEKNIIKIDPTLKSVEECTQDYQTKLQELLTEQEKFKINFLYCKIKIRYGHTAKVTSVKDSPKPPPERVTLTLNTINQAKNKIAVVTGESKSTIVKEVIQDKNKNYPIGQVQNLVWYLDK